MSDLVWHGSASFGGGLLIPLNILTVAGEGLHREFWATYDHNLVGMFVEFLAEWQEQLAKKLPTR